ncbi:Alpha-1,6-mannosylglycoprotein 6-beta-N-acetylglucosaminyltransferase A [Varanus komodoensis]|nr:Alpha-1,6-mannosylglycoprotein 6-beta-N-acetylglucosaminyltransferase A [Varanus komodoensis]
MSAELPLGLFCVLLSDIIDLMFVPDGIALLAEPCFLLFFVDDTSLFQFGVQNSGAFVEGVGKMPTPSIPVEQGFVLLLKQHSDKKSYLDVIHTYTEVHGTVHGTSTIYMPNYVKNHGILSGRDLQFLLRGTKLFVGLGFPYEGPAPLEAIANGCAFLNPKFNPPKSSKNTDFFKGKPTLRELTSQHPYAEVYIGRPHVWTVNINDLSEVEKAVKAILSQKIEPYLPFEFTCEGMLQRMNVFIEKQVCSPYE